MNVKLKKLLIWIVIVSSLLLSVCSCEYTPSIVKNSKEEGDFVYSICEHEDGTKYAVLLDFSEAGKEKEVIFVPEFIGGEKIERFNLTRGYSYYGEMKSDNLKRIYFQYDIGLEDRFYNCPKIEKVLTKTRLSFVICIEEMRFPNDNETNDKWTANVTYCIENEVYMIDDYDYGTAITVQPPEPTKEGYKFVGWYKESDCINKWEFETDVLPEEKRDENEHIIYQETKLYAKWEES